MKPVARPNVYRQHILDVLLINSAKGLARNVSDLNVERFARRLL